MLCRLLLAVLAGVLLAPRAALADPVAVHHPEGTLHGFLSLSNANGKVIAVGDLLQVAEDDKVTAHLIFHFKDGSLDDETTVFTQKGTFKLIADHHVQKGPFFPTQIDMSIDAGTGEVTVRSKDKDGKEDVKTEHMDLPPDLYNGMVTPIAKNLNPETAETKVSMVVATPAPRLVTLAFSPRPVLPFILAGARRKALGYEIKFELGGLAGIVAPLIGKKPPNVQIWVEGGELPTFIKETGPTYAQGPILTIQLTSPTWLRGSRSASAK